MDTVWCGPVDALDKGHVRIQTAFLYPDGSHVDVFVPGDAPLLPPSKLTDLGQTMSWLLDLQVRPGLSKKRQRLVEDALRIYDVEQIGGALITSFPSMDEIVDGVVRLGQACVRGLRSKDPGSGPLVPAYGSGNRGAVTPQATTPAPRETAWPRRPCGPTAASRPP